MTKQYALATLAIVVVTLVSCKQASDDTPIDPSRSGIGLVAHYSMDGSGIDVSGNAFHAGNYNGLPVANRHGEMGRAMKFVWDTDHLEVRNTKNTAFEMKSAMTLSFWIKGHPPTDRQGSTNVISKIDQFQDGWWVQWMDYKGTAELQFRLTYGTTYGSSNMPSDVIAVPVDMFINAWHHVAYTYSLATRTARMYVDGELAETLTNCQYAFTHSDDVVKIGGDARSFVGQTGKQPIELDNMKVYDIELTAAEIRASYAE